MTALVVGDQGDVLARGYREFACALPRLGRARARGHLDGDRRRPPRGAGRLEHQPTCIGITDQRETVVWDRRALPLPRPAIVWQDGRTTGICDRLRPTASSRGSPSAPACGWTRTSPARSSPGSPPSTSRRCGQCPGRRAGARYRRLLRDRPAHRAAHVTDPSNASRTLLYDLEKGAWSDELCDLFDVPRSAPPEVVPSSGVVGTTDPDAFLGLSLPIAGIAGDQQAALFGQACHFPGMSKCTYGTGSFVLTNTGPTPVRSTPACSRPWPGTSATGWSTRSRARSS